MPPRIGQDDLVQKGHVDIDDNEAAIVRRIFTENAPGVSPLKIAAQLNANGIPSPAAKMRRKNSSHWRQTTINGKPYRGRQRQSAPRLLRQR
ncbi:recombinase family protein [Pacificibacter marinus]|uniref:recombinase family protein n=1 Tax=Pacificibacter marinus TaxID=658057 RepID=UPI000B8873A8